MGWSNVFTAKTWAKAKIQKNLYSAGMTLPFEVPSGKLLPIIIFA
jgi:hypothetical protein